MSLWTSGGQLGINEGVLPKSCGQGGESSIPFESLNVTDQHIYKYLVVGKKFFQTIFDH
jgi:hypothetical protein